MNYQDIIFDKATTQVSVDVEKETEALIIDYVFSSIGAASLFLLERELPLSFIISFITKKKL